MDAMTGLLRGPRADGAFVLRIVMASPWGIAIRDEAPVTVAVVLSGSAWVAGAAGTSHLLVPGQVGIVRGPDHYLLADQPDRDPSIVVHPGQRCETADGVSLEQPFMRGVRTWGNDPEGDTVLMIGTYERVGQAAAGLLRALPHLTVVEGVTPAIIDLVAAEVTRDAPGQGAVLDRLLDVLTVAALRSWFDDVAGSAPGWWRAADDPVAGPAVRLVQHNPGHPWTVASLAAAVGVSRALLARRFTAAVGQPPMAFLTEWRLALAADLLLEPGATVQQVASRVGYGSGFALSAAFKRVHGESPTAHRRRMLAS